MELSYSHTNSQRILRQRNILAVAAVAATSDGAVEIWLAAGTYEPGVTRSDTFVIPSGIAL